MTIRRSLSLWATLLIACLGAACQQPPRPAPAPSYYYIVPEITYLRDGPAFDANVVAQVYKGEQVEPLDTAEAGWMRVRSGRTAQVGWLPEDLLSPSPVPVNYYYVTAKNIKLRECPLDDCPAMQMLFWGERVQKIEQNDRGWWRVLVAQGRALGWVPAAAVSERLVEARAHKAQTAYLYVAAPRLALREQPEAGAHVTRTLKHNDQVEQLEVNQSGWVKVRQPASGAVGWVQQRHLEPLPSRPSRRMEPPKKPPVPKLPAPPKEAPPPEPEVM